MREIEFRGKDIETGEWRHGSYLHPDSILVHDDKTGAGRAYQIDRKTLSEYTGCKDKNGKKIFEVDIVQWSEPAPWDQQDTATYTGRVYWQEDRWAIAGGQGNPALRGVGPLEIIGNVWDRPELLERQGCQDKD